MTRRAWSTLDYLVKTTPDEFCDVPAPGQGVSDRVFMLQQAERIARLPTISREDRATIECVWLGQARPRLRVAS